MDPDRCYDEMVEAILAGEKRRAMELAEILAEWCGKCGFPPRAIVPLPEEFVPYNLPQTRF
jgi:hypothetical protein